MGAPEGYKWQGRVWAHAVVERPWLAMLFHLVSPPFPGFNDRFSASPDWHFLRAWIESLLIGGCGYSHVSA